MALLVILRKEFPFDVSPCLYPGFLWLPFSHLGKWLVQVGRLLMKQTMTLNKPQVIDILMAMMLWVHLSG